MPEPVMDATTEVEEWLAARLENASRLFPVAGNRVFPVNIPSLEVMPCVVYRRSGTQRDRHMTAASGEAKARFVVSCLAAPNTEGYKQTLQMAKAIRLECDGFKGSDNKGHFVRSLFVEDEADEPDAAVPLDGALQVIQKRSLVIVIAYLEQKRVLSGGS